MDPDLTARLNAGLTSLYNEWFAVLKELADEGEPRARRLLEGSLPDPDSVYAIRLDPEAVIVLQYDDELTADQAKRLRDQMNHVLPDNKVVVMSAGLRIETEG